MRKMETAEVCLGREDRAAVFEYEEGVVLVVADGAGGTGGGALAAEAVVEGVRRVGWSPSTDTWMDLLGRLNHSVAPGQTTAVVVALGESTLAGASVGDSGAWWFGAAGEQELTRGQYRTPLLGSGEVSAVASSSRTDARAPWWWRRMDCGSTSPGSDSPTRSVAPPRRPPTAW